MPESLTGTIIVSYDKWVDAVAIRFNDSRVKSARTDPLWPSIVGDITNLDFDAKGRLYQLEMLSARRRLLPAVLASRDPLAEGHVSYSYDAGKRVARFVFPPAESEVRQCFSVDKAIVLALSPSRRLVWVEIRDPGQIPAGFAGAAVND